MTLEMSISSCVIGDEHVTLVGVVEEDPQPCGPGTRRCCGREFNHVEPSSSTGLTWPNAVPTIPSPRYHRISQRPRAPSSMCPYLLRAGELIPGGHRHTVTPRRCPRPSSPVPSGHGPDRSTVISRPSASSIYGSSMCAPSCCPGDPSLEPPKVCWLSPKRLSPPAVVNEVGLLSWLGALRGLRTRVAPVVAGIRRGLRARDVDPSSQPRVVGTKTSPQSVSSKKIRNPAVWGTGWRRGRTLQLCPPVTADWPELPEVRS